jgi:hypothetical protein
MLFQLHKLSLYSASGNSGIRTPSRYSLKNIVTKTSLSKILTDAYSLRKMRLKLNAMWYHWSDRPYNILRRVHDAFYALFSVSRCFLPFRTKYILILLRTLFSNNLSLYVCMDGCAPRYRLNGWLDFIHTPYLRVHPSQACVRWIWNILALKRGPFERAPKAKWRFSGKRPKRFSFISAIYGDHLPK